MPVPSTRRAAISSTWPSRGRARRCAARRSPSGSCVTSLPTWPALGRRHAGAEPAVDDERPRRAERGFVGREEQRHRGHLLRAADPAERMHPSGLGPGCVRVGLDLEVALRHPGVDIAGADAVASDPVAAVLERDRAGEVDHTALRGAVRSQGRLDPEPVHGRHVHDRPTAQPAHAGDGGPGAQVDAAQVHAEHPVPVLRRRVLERVLVLDRRIGDDRVRPAVALGGRHDRLHLVRVGHVAAVRFGPAAGGDDRLDRRLGAAGIHVGAQGDRPLDSQPLCDRPADPGRRAGYHADLAFHPHDRSLPRVHDGRILRHFDDQVKWPTVKSTSGRRPTMRDVAEHAGVSAQTVSNLVNNRLRQMSDETRLRIEGAMEQLGYYPNLTARSLRSARTTTIGFLLLDEGARYLADPMTDQVIAGVGDVARDCGYSVLIHAGLPGPPDRGLLRPVLESRVDGVLLFLSGPPAQRRWYPSRAAELGVPTVLLEEASPGEGALMSVTADNRDGARRLADHLIASGHTRIAFIAARQPWPMVEQRHLGYCEALAAAGLERNSDFELFEGIWDAADAGKMVDRLLDLPEPPTATVHVPGYEIGRTAAQLLIGHLDGETTAPPRVTLPVELRLRGSA